MRIVFMCKVVGIKVIFYKDWRQIGCKYFDIEKDKATIDNCKEWLKNNHNMDVIKHVRFKIIRENIND